MGVSGLLPQLRSITKRVHISDYRGSKIAIDSYVLLHKGAYSCARELVEGEPTEKHIAYCISRIELLLKHGVTPICIFDGGVLPNKSDEEQVRARSRQENRDKARELWSHGNKTAALECYNKAVDITPAIAHQFVEALQARGIEFIVAPYEADAQCAYLCLNGIVDAVLTEDSDLLAYGCSKVLFKVDWNGDVDEISLSDLPNCRELSFVGWTHDLFQQMCVLAGCDFVSLPGIGIKKAHAHIRRTKDFMRALRALRFDGVSVPKGYEMKFQRALWTFRHQRVYCPRRKKVVHLTELPGGSLEAQAAVPAAAKLENGEPDFLGPPIEDDEISQGIAEGRLNPVTYQPFEPRQSAPYSLSKRTTVPGLIDPVGLQLGATKSAKQKYKKPRLAGDVGDEANVIGDPGSKAKSLGKATTTVKKYFPPQSGIGEATAAPAPAQQQRGVSLRQTLQAALRGGSTRLPLPPPQSASSEGLHDKGDSFKLSSQQEEFPEARLGVDREGDAHLGQPRCNGLGGGGATFLEPPQGLDTSAPLWRPRACLPSNDSDSHIEEVPLTVHKGNALTPGFYPGTSTTNQKKIPSTTQQKSSWKKASPRLLDFQPKRPVDLLGYGECEADEGGQFHDGQEDAGDDAADAAQIDPRCGDLMDLRHVAAYKIEAAAAVDAAEQEAKEDAAAWKVESAAPGVAMQRRVASDMANRPFVLPRRKAVAVTVAAEGSEPDVGGSGVENAPLPFAKFSFK